VVNLWLILVDAFVLALSVTVAFASLLALAIPFALCAEVVAKHGSENEVLFWR
jgi:hypothetical protein